MNELAAVGPLSRVALFRALQLGDLLCAVPALRALRRALPGVEITLIGLPWARAFVDRFGAYLDSFIEFPGYPGLPERETQVRLLPGFLAEIQARRFDLAIQMHGSGTLTNPLVVSFGARHTAGYFLPGEFCPDAALSLPFPEQENEVRMQLRLMEALGVPAAGESLEFPLSEADRSELGSIPEAAMLTPGSYACIHPGARLPSRRWPAERFAAVADSLAERGLSIVLTGSDAERGLTARVRAQMRAPAVDLAGLTSLGALGALIDGARLLLCNDTGVSHVAAALGTPSVVVACGSDARRWAPLDQSRHRVLWHPIQCRPCAFHDCPIGHPCASAVSVEDVIAEAGSLLAGGGSEIAAQVGAGGRTWS